MANNLTSEPIQVLTNDPLEINAAFSRIQEQLDAARGLRGRATIHDRVKVDDPLVSSDAVNLANRDAGGLLTLAALENSGFTAGRMTYGTDIIYYTDVNGTVLHAFGNV